MITIKHSKFLTWSLWIIFFLAGLNTGVMVEARTLRFGHYADEDLAVGQTARRFANLLNEYARGRLRIDVYPSSQLGSARSMFDATREGGIDLTLAPATYLRDIAPRMDILGLPFLFRDRQHSFDVLDGPIGKMLLADAEKYWLKGFI